MRRWLLICTFFLFTTTAYSQDAVKPTGTLVCPADYVCITVKQAQDALIDSETVKNQAQQIDDLGKAIDGYKDEIAKLRIEIARLTGEKTGAEQMNVRLTAIIDFLLKNGRIKKYGIINF